MMADVSHVDNPVMARIFEAKPKLCIAEDNLQRRADMLLGIQTRNKQKHHSDLTQAKANKMQSIMMDIGMEASVSEDQVGQVPHAHAVDLPRRKLTTIDALDNTCFSPDGEMALGYSMPYTFCASQPNFKSGHVSHLTTEAFILAINSHNTRQGSQPASSPESKRPHLEEADFISS
eukprot:TRINITY_DN9733_c0_g1_i1.p2 TRINITY_DN9733_c0_g1~~TRINITY_DN9733_c0_g1_i1.p2  ORF type:complete len:176 (-),score=33.93 TRINITY_DN9733_c0_g1_i1:718-1245(-)